MAHAAYSGNGKLAVVFGGSGFVGRNVVRELAAQGWRVRVAVRRPHLAHYLKPLGAVGQIQLSQANIRHRPSIAEVLRGADAVVNLVGILAQDGQQTFSAVQAQGARNIAEMAAKEGVTNIVHLSAIGADLESDSLYAQSKAEGEAAMRAVLPSTTILRPSVIFGPKDDFFNRFAAMARLSPCLPLIGGGKTKFQPVYVDDVADAVAVALSDEVYDGRLYELGGPEVVTFKQCMELMLRIIGRKRLLAPLPFSFASSVGATGDFIAHLPFLQAPITADQVRLLKSDNICGLTGDDTIGTIEDLGINPDTMEAILPTYLVRFRKRGQFSPETA